VCVFVCVLCDCFFQCVDVCRKNIGRFERDSAPFSDDDVWVRDDQPVEAILASRDRPNLELLFDELFGEGHSVYLTLMESWYSYIICMNVDQH
jgi:hypothetical protein